MPLFPERLPQPFHVCSQKAIIEATMHFPLAEDAERRGQLACFLDFHRSVSFDILTADDSCSGREVYLAYHGRYLDELGTSYDDIFARSFYAAHWLRYRLYASLHFPQLNSTNRWEYYVANDVVHKLPDHWNKGRTRFIEARKEFASVAHLWLAKFDEQGPGLNPFPREGFVPQPPPWPNPNYFERFLRRANGYFLAAKSAGLYGNRPGQFPLDDVWQLGEMTGTVPVPELDTPDLLVPDFDPEWYRDDYVPRSQRPAAKYQIE